MKRPSEKLCPECLKPLILLFDGIETWFICECGHDEKIGKGNLMEPIRDGTAGPKWKVRKNDSST